MKWGDESCGFVPCGLKVEESLVDSSMVLPVLHCFAAVACMMISCLCGCLNDIKNYIDVYATYKTFHL